MLVLKITRSSASGRRREARSRVDVMNRRLEAERAACKPHGDFARSPGARAQPHASLRLRRVLQLDCREPATIAVAAEKKRARESSNLLRQEEDGKWRDCGPENAAWARWRLFLPALRPGSGSRRSDLPSGQALRPRPATRSSLKREWGWNSPGPNKGGEPVLQATAADRSVDRPGPSNACHPRSGDPDDSNRVTASTSS